MLVHLSLILPLAWVSTVTRELATQEQVPPEQATLGLVLELALELDSEELQVSVVALASCCLLFPESKRVQQQAVARHAPLWEAKPDSSTSHPAGT